MLPALLLVTLLSPAWAAVGAPTAPTPSQGWGRPVPGEVLRTADLPDPDWLPGHRGVDLAARPGEVVRAIGPGTVAFAGRVGGRPTVTTQHGRLVSTYQPVVAAPGVVPGMDVRRGAAIGRIASTAPMHCPATCLHWGVRVDGRYADPLRLVGRVVLKPLG